MSRRKGGGSQTPGTPHTFPLDPPMNKVQTMTIQKYKKNFEDFYFETPYLYTEKVVIAAGG